jgi:membrane protein
MERLDVPIGSPRRQAEHGRETDRPRHIPVRGWKDVLLRAYCDSGTKNLSLVAGGVTYYVLIALFPGLAALVSLYGLVADPHQIETEVGAMSGLMVPSTQKLISTELHQLVSVSSGALGVGAAVGILVALYSASRGMAGMISALDIAYGEEERRGFLRFNLTAILLTLVMLLAGSVAIALVAVLPAVLQTVGGAFKWIPLIGEWPLLAVFMLATLAVLYRFAPDRAAPRWEWTSPGAIAATALWIVGSLLFTVYVAHFGTYNKTYGTLGALVVLLTWLWLSVYVVLLGAAINAEAERQTRRDAPIGPPPETNPRNA